MPDEHAELLGGSSAERRYHCAASYRLEPGIPGHTSVAAERGTRLHEHIAAMVKGGSPSGLPAADATAVTDAYEAFMQLCETYRIETLLVERRVDPQLGFESFGTVDVIGIGLEHVLVVDWKFGYHAVESGNNYQLQYYAYAAMQDPKLQALLPSGGYQVVGAIIQPSKRPFGAVSVTEYDEEALGAVALEWKDNHAVGNAAEPVKGSWCQWCKAKPTCPAHVPEVSVVSSPDAGGPAPTFDVSVNGLALGEQLKQWREQQEWVNSRVEALERAVFVKVEAGESVPGWKLVDKRASRHWVDIDAAERFLRRKVGVDNAMPRKLISPPQAEKVLGPDYRLLEKHVTRESSGVKLVPEEAEGDAVDTSQRIKKLTGD